VITELADLVVHWADPAGQVPEPTTWMTADEQARWLDAGTHTRAYAQKRWLLRAAVGAAPGRAIEIRQVCSRCGSRDHGPVAARVVGGAWLHVSLSAHGGYAAAVADSKWVGVDVVVVEEAADPALDHALSPDEVRLVRAAPDPVGQRARLWARKEAVLKATGRGLQVDPAAVPVLGDEVMLAGVALRVGDRPLIGAPQAVLAWAHAGHDRRPVHLTTCGRD